MPDAGTWIFAGPDVGLASLLSHGGFRPALEPAVV